VELALLDWGPLAPADAPLALLHHANGLCGATFAPVARSLADRFRVITVDARGHGDSTSVPPGHDPDPYDWNVLAADLLAAIEAICAHAGQARIALGIGHSFGGRLMLRVAAQQPSRLERLLLCDPVILPQLTPEQRSKARGSGNPMAAATRKRRDRFPSRREAFDHCRSRALFADFTPECLALYVGEGMAETDAGEIRLKCDREVEAAIFEAGASVDPIPGLGEVTADVLFVHAARGNFSRPFYEQVASEIQRARVESLDGGHLFPLEAPDRVPSLVDALLEEPSTTRPRRSRPARTRMED
jgi:pimeloyl-ACP methyl ester carboxylesterase